MSRRSDEKNSSNSSIIIFICLALNCPAAAWLTCQQPLGLEDGRIQDFQLTASSSFQPASVGSAMGRLNSELRGGAWCPRSFISQETGLQEFLEVDLLQEHTITGVITQGRFANGQGQEYAEHFQLQYWRDDMEAFVDYVDNTGKVPVLPGNLNTYEAARVLLDPPVLTRKIRILPYSQHPRTVCMRVELLGCQLARKSLEVSVPAQTAASHLAVEPRLASAVAIETRTASAAGYYSFSLVATVLGSLLTVTSLLVLALVLVLLRNRRSSSMQKLASLSDISISGSIYQQQQQHQPQQLECGGGYSTEPVYQEPRQPGAGSVLCSEYASPLSIWSGSVYNIYQAPGDSSTDLSYLEESSVDSASTLGTPRLPPLPDFDRSPSSGTLPAIYVNQCELLQYSTSL